VPPRATARWPRVTVRPAARGWPKRGVISSPGAPYALATAALLPQTVAYVCLFAPVGPYGQPGLHFAEGIEDCFREEIRILFAKPGRARAGFRAPGMICALGS